MNFIKENLRRGKKYIFIKFFLKKKMFMEEFMMGTSLSLNDIVEFDN